MKMNRFLKGRAAPWAWMQTGPLTVDVEARLSNNDRECERIPASIHTEAVVQAECVNMPTERADSVERTEPQLPQRQGTALAVPLASEPSGVSTPEVSETKDGKLTLDDFPALKAAVESFEKRGDPIMISVDTEPSSTQPAPKRRRSNAKRRKSRSKQVVKGVNLHPAVPRKQPQPRTQAEIDLSRHERRCTICRHPEREAIEEAFLQWRNVKFIAREFNAAGGYSAVYRHARALGLFKKRNFTLRSALEFVIEQSERIMPTAEGLVKAIRAYTRINDSGEWIDTPTTHIVQVVAMPFADPRKPTNAVPGLTLDIRKEQSQMIEFPVRQALLTENALHSEIPVTD
jgi:hypothetical protein